MITRQHESTTVDELRGARCSQLLAVRAASGELGLLFLQTDHTWHRFFIDAGLLFWNEGIAPDDEDMLDDEQYIDLAAQLKATNAAIQTIEMRDCVLRLEFGNGARLLLKQTVEDAGTTIVEATPSRG